MEITIEIPDELAGEVQARALTPEGFVRSLIDDAAHFAKTPLLPAKPKTPTVRVGLSNCDLGCSGGLFSAWGILNSRTLSSGSGILSGHECPTLEKVKLGQGALLAGIRSDGQRQFWSNAAPLRRISWSPNGHGF
jgi:hypothetical protein